MRFVTTGSWLQNLSGISTMPSGTASVFSFVHPVNVPVPSAVTPAGIVTLVRFVQHENTASPISDVFGDQVTDDRPVQRAKARSPTDVTRLGISIVFSQPWPANASAGICVSVLGKATVVRFVSASSA